MYKSTARAASFMDRTGSDATKGSRTGVDLLGIGADPTTELTDDQKLFNERAALVRTSQLLNHEMAQLRITIRRTSTSKTKPPEEFFAALARIDVIKLELSSAMQRLGEIKRLRSQPATGHEVIQCFVDVARETLPRSQFNRFMEEARARADAARKT